MHDVKNKCLASTSFFDCFSLTSCMEHLDYVGCSTSAFCEYVVSNAVRIGDRSFAVTSPRVRNCLPAAVWALEYCKQFRTHLRPLLALLLGAFISWFYNDNYYCVLDLRAAFYWQTPAAFCRHAAVRPDWQPQARPILPIMQLEPVQRKLDLSFSGRVLEMLHPCSLDRTGCISQLDVILSTSCDVFLL